MTQVIANPAELTALRDALCKQEAALSADGHQCIRLCLGASCIASGALKFKAALERDSPSGSCRIKCPSWEPAAWGPVPAAP